MDWDDDMPDYLGMMLHHPSGPESNQIAFQIDYDAYYDLPHSDEYKNYLSL